MSPQLAIVIPYYKAAFFKETLQSVLDQTNKEFKLYIADDASPESYEQETAKLLRSEVHYSYHRFETNAGQQSLVSHWNRAIALTKEEPWLCILGDDDLISPNFVAQFYESLPMLESQPSNLLRMGHQRIDQHGESLGPACQHPALQMSTKAFEAKYYGNATSSLSEYVFRRSVYEEVGFRDYPLAWCSDDMAWLEFSQGLPILGNNKAILSFRLSSESISGRAEKDRKNEAKKQFFSHLVNHKWSLFSKSTRLKNLRKLEQYYALTKNYDLSAMGFFFKQYLKLGNLKEALKTLRRGFINAKRK